MIALIPGYRLRIGYGPERFEASPPGSATADDGWIMSASQWLLTGLAAWGATGLLVALGLGWIIQRAGRRNVARRRGFETVRPAPAPVSTLPGEGRLGLQRDAGAEARTLKPNPI